MVEGSKGTAVQMHMCSGKWQSTLGQNSGFLEPPCRGYLEDLRACSETKQFIQMLGCYTEGLPSATLPLSEHARPKRRRA